MSSGGPYRKNDNFYNKKKVIPNNSFRIDPILNSGYGIKYKPDIEMSSDLSLYTEYVQWDFINNFLYKIGEKKLNIADRFKQEYTNTLQRWFIYINEHFNDVPKYSYFPILPKIRINHSAAEFLRDAFVDKRLAYEDHASATVDDILELTERHHLKIQPHNTTVSLKIIYDPTNFILKVDNFRSPKILSMQLLVDRAGLVATAKMLLRYESFGNGSYQWGDPKEVHHVLYENFNVRYEGFASPVNSRFIKYPDTFFCSLFPETDAVFGSLGNFFHVDMKVHVGGWSVNPPFLNDLMKKVAERIIEVLDNGYKGYFFCTFPCWEDDEGWRLMDNSRHLFKRFDLPPQHFIVQDAYGKTFKPNMSMNMFVMGEVPTNVSRLSELGNTLVLEPQTALPDDCPW